MKKKIIILFVLICSSCIHHFEQENYSSETTQTGNTYPVIFVHGFLGFPRDLMDGFYYWGGFNDVETNLSLQGFEVYSTSCGSFSSNWDRACELYAYIKGGRVDYGAVHSRNNKHERFGRTYPGVYPEWGTIDPNTGEIKKINIISHSMGGQTVRLLAWMLENGSQEESLVDDFSSFFSGDNNWIHSIMTISTPHNGTTYTEFFMNDWPFYLYLIKGFTSIPTRPGEDRSEYNFDVMLDQWNLYRNEGESYYDFRDRIYKTIDWPNGKDTALYDLSLVGADDFNQKYPDSSEIYYLSWATQTTNGFSSDRSVAPSINTFSFLWSSCFYMGNHGEDSDWYPNDGVVNTVSMKGPFNGIISDEELQLIDIKKGIWNYMGLLNETDHIKVLGMSVDGMIQETTVTQWYAEQCKLLLELP